MFVAVSVCRVLNVYDLLLTVVLNLKPAGSVIDEGNNGFTTYKLIDAHAAFLDPTVYQSPPARLTSDDRNCAVGRNDSLSAKLARSEL